MLRGSVSSLLSCHSSQITKLLIWTEGGLLGWREIKFLKTGFKEVAKDLEPSTLKSPIIGEGKTDQGYHLIVVHDRK
jgi:parvulin-like peptidyl-prolyl isomerase